MYEVLYHDHMPFSAALRNLHQDVLEGGGRLAVQEKERFVYEHEAYTLQIIRMHDGKLLALAQYEKKPAELEQINTKFMLWGFRRNMDEKLVEEKKKTYLAEEGIEPVDLHEPRWTLDDLLGES